jgi:hypothetical protein
MSDVMGAFIVSFVTLGLTLACALALSVFLCVKRVKLDVPRVLQLVGVFLSCSCALVSLVVVAPTSATGEAAAAFGILQNLAVSLLAALVLVLLYVWSLAVHSPLGERPTFELVWTVLFFVVAIALNVATLVLSVLWTVRGIVSTKLLQIFGLFMLVSLGLIATALLVYGVVLMIMLCQHQSARGDQKRLRSFLAILSAFFLIWCSVFAVMMTGLLLFLKATQASGPALIFVLFALPYTMTGGGVLFLLLFSVLSASAQGKCACVVCVPRVLLTSCSTRDLWSPLCRRC